MKKELINLLCGVPITECTDSKCARGFLLMQIEKKYGKQVADETDLKNDLRTFARWHFDGYRVKPGEKSLIGVRLAPPRHEGTATTIRKPKPVRYFHRFQVRCVRY